MEIPPSTKVPLQVHWSKKATTEAMKELNSIPGVSASLVVEIHKNEPLHDILTQAMDAEEKTAIFCHDLAKKLRNGEAASLMQYLSSVERSHYYLLESEKELLMQIEKYSGNYKYYSLNS